MVLFWSQNGPKMDRYSPIGSKNGSERVKNGSSGARPVPKSSGPSSKLLKTHTQNHSGHFQTHPPTAHSHRLKRRLVPHRNVITTVLFCGPRGGFWAILGIHKSSVGPKMVGSDHVGSSSDDFGNVWHHFGLILVSF